MKIKTSGGEVYRGEDSIVCLRGVRVWYEGNVLPIRQLLEYVCRKRGVSTKIDDQFSVQFCHFTSVDVDFFKPVTLENK